MKKKYPRSEPEKYKSLRYRTSDEQIIDALYEGLRLLLADINVFQFDYDRIVAEFERLRILRQARLDYRRIKLRNLCTCNACTKRRERRANRINH
jgi:hypothetical protein